MALLDRPNRPELPDPKDYPLVKGKTENLVFWFIPDCPSFGFWFSRNEGESAREVWLKNFRSARQSDWAKYCQSRGYKQFHFR